jgi:hypothetical protein
MWTQGLGLVPSLGRVCPGWQGELESEPMGTLGLLPWLEGGGRREEERPAGRSHRDGPVLMPVAAKTHALPRYKRIGSVGARTLPS